MCIELIFDCRSFLIFVPDGYIVRLKDIQEDFLEWMQQQQECIANANDRQEGYSYNEKNFLKYINSVVLKESKEKAYFIPSGKKHRRKKCTIHF